MFKNIGAVEITIVAVVVLIIFFPKKIPEFARGIIEFIKELKNSFKEGTKSK